MRDPGPTGDGTLRALNAADGTSPYRADLGASNPGPINSAAVADGRVYTGDFAGGLRIYGPPS